MVEMACAEFPGPNGVRFEASRLEEGTERSYSIDTIRKLQATLRDGDQLFFLIGADAFADLQTWHRWQDVVSSVRFIVAGRPGYSYDAPGDAKVERLDEMELMTSSSNLRHRLSAGNQLLDAPAGVIEYIHSHGLYGTSQM